MPWTVHLSPEAEKQHSRLPHDLQKRIANSEAISRKGCSMVLKVVLEQGEDGYYVAHCPSLKSCWSQGRTREEALTNIAEAIALYLEPKPTELIADNRHEVVEITL